jgi:hypothetical protein
MKYYNLYDKIDYWTMYVEGDLSLDELLKLLADYV